MRRHHMLCCTFLCPNLLLCPKSMHSFCDEKVHIFVCVAEEQALGHTTLSQLHL